MNKKIRKIALGVLRYFPKTRNKVRKAYYAKRKRQYDALAASIPTDKNKVLFESFGGKQYACSPRAIYERMISNPRFDDYELIWSFRESCCDTLSEEEPMKRATVVVRGSDDYWKACAESGCWIANNRMPEYFEPKTDQIYVQCWHGTPLKKLGYDLEKMNAALNTAEELAERFRTDSKKWTFLVSPSAYTSQHLSDAFGLPLEKRERVILEKGYPRNDKIVSKTQDPKAMSSIRKKICQQLNLDPNKKLLLYAPTWRDDCYNASVGYVMKDTLLDFEKMKAQLNDEWCILFRAHYYISNQFDFSAFDGFVADASKNMDINDLYIIADALLTDYSSVFFDYANTGRPMMFFWPDFDHYVNDLHGFYLDLTELPGPQCKTNEEVIHALLDISSYQEKYGESYQRFIDKFCPLDDGNASQRVIDAIFPSNR